MFYQRKLNYPFKDNENLMSAGFFFMKMIGLSKFLIDKMNNFKDSLIK